MKIHTRLAKPVSYGGTRALTEIKYIVFHYTGNKGDTAQNNADFFATSNTRQAGAHFFVDKTGSIYRSIEMHHIAWAVGGKYSLSNGAGRYYGKCTNANSVSIELCDCTTDVSWKQMKAARQLVKYIQRKCPNARTIIRHWDVNGKTCPAPMIGENNEKWNRLHTFVTKGYQYKAKIIKTAAIRSSGKVTVTNRIGTAKVGQVVKITKVVGKWGRLKKKSVDGKYRWVELSKIKRND